jgi:hypothetical protein
MQFSPTSYHLTHLRSKYSPQDPLFKHAQSSVYVSALMSETKFHTHIETWAKV